MSDKNKNIKFLFSVWENKRTKERYILSTDENDNAFSLHSVKSHKNSNFDNNFLTDTKDYERIQLLSKHGDSIHFSRLENAINQRKNKTKKRSSTCLK